MLDETMINHWPGWETVRLLGRGSFGSVYEIRRVVFDNVEKAALKVISIPYNRSDIDEMYNDGYDSETITTVLKDHLRNIVSEYSLMRKMNGSANIVNCDDVQYIAHKDHLGWNVYIKMELLTPLNIALKDGYDEDTVIDLGIGICSALELCKSYDIVHRDIKPQNIFVSPHGDYKLGDFGIAKTIEKTSGGTKIGTYKYMAPEVYNNQPYGSASDIYSLGLVLYWLLNERRLPFYPLPPNAPTASIDEEARRRRFEGEPIPAPLHGSAELKNIVLKACAFHPKDRFAGAAEMKAALLGLRSNSAVSIVPPVTDSNPVVTHLALKEDIVPKFVEGNETIGVWDYKTMTQSDATQTPSVAPTSTSTASTCDDEELTVGAGIATNIPTGKGNPPTSVPSKPPVQNNATFPSSNQISASSDQSDKEEKSNKKGFIAILSACVAVVLILCLLLPKLRNSGGDAEELLQNSTTEEATTVPTTASTVETTTETDATTTSPDLPVQLEWSQWSDSLPDYVSEENYLIEENTLYSSRTLETQSSTTTNSIDGWELYNTAEGKGDFGAWTSWSTNSVSASDSREVQTEIRYRSSKKETSTGNSSSKSGWELYNTTYSWSNYGNWSDWSTNSVSNSDSRKVETKTQYRYRDISYTTEYTDWGNWSAWQDGSVSSGDLRQIQTRTVWGYYYFLCPYCGVHMHGWGTCYTWAGGCGRKTDDSGWRVVWSETSWNNAGLKDWYGTGKYYTYINGELVFKWPDGGNAKTQYRYRDRTTYQKANPGSWSSWSDSSYSSSSTREVETRTVYRYADRSQIATYHFYRWGDWSSWSTGAVSSNNDRKVETATFYRYRDRVDQTTYYFRRWTEWSEYSSDYVASSDTVEVETQTVYRYKSK